MRLPGTILFLFLFSHSYYAVGSVRNALGSGPQDGLVRAFALMHGIAVIGLFVASILLLRSKRSGLRLARAGAVTLALVNVIGGMVFRNGPGPDLFGALLTLSQPVYPAFLFVVLPRAGGTAGMRSSRNVPAEAGLLLFGALLPWIAALFWGTPASSVRPAVGLFMTFWSTVPFFVAVLTARVSEDAISRKVTLAGGAIGTAVGSLYGYGLLWDQGGNSFLLALIPPLVFASQALGIVIAMAFGRNQNTA